MDATLLVVMVTMVAMVPGHQALCVWLSLQHSPNPISALKREGWRKGSGNEGKQVEEGKGSEVRSFNGQWAAIACAAPPSIIAGQYATSNCKLLLVMFIVSSILF